MNNENLIIKKIQGNQSIDFIKCLEIRKKVFVEEQQVPEEIEADEYDATAFHYLVIQNDKNEQIPLATARWRNTTIGIKLERFAVLKPYRKQGLGSLILKEILNDTLPLNKEIYLHAQESAVTFYVKHGFMVSGQAFYEANMKHYKMILKK